MNRNHLRRPRRGFTLIEIMVVVLIIGLLATLVAPNVLRALFQGQQTRVKSDIREIEAALTMYNFEKHKFPDSLEELTQEDENGHAFLTAKSVPKDPWGNQYFYDPPRSGGSDYTLGSYGRDGAPGGDGEDKDITNQTLAEEEGQ